MLMDSAIICFHFRKIHRPVLLKITAVSLIRNTLAITLTDLLKKDLTFTSISFKGHLMRILLPRMHFLLLLLSLVVAVVVVLVVVVVAVGVVVMVVIVVVVVVVLVAEILIVQVAVVVVKS